MILNANSIVKQSKRQKAGKLYLWILITTYYLLSKNWDIFATRCRISLIINIDYLRGGEVINVILKECRQDIVCTLFKFIRHGKDKSRAST